MSDEPLSVNVTKVKMPQGGKTPEHMLRDFDIFCQNKTGSINVVRNTDNSCLPRAIVLGKAYADKSTDPKKYENLRKKDRSKALTDAATELSIKAGVLIGPHGGGIEDIRKTRNV